MTTSSYTETKDLARRVQSARGRLDDILSATGEEPTTTDALQILHDEDLLGADETELVGALWVILTTLKDTLDALADRLAITTITGPVEQARLLREAEEATISNITRARVLIMLADRWGDLPPRG